MGKSVRKIPSFEEVMQDEPKKKVPSFEEVMGEPAPKKKVGSIDFEQSSVTPSVSEAPLQLPSVKSEDIIKLANEYNKVSGRISEISKPIATPGGGSLTAKPSETDINRLPEIEKSIKDAGYDPKEILQEFKDFPVTPNADIPKLLQEKKDNPLSFERTKAAFKWQTPLFQAIRSKEPELAENIISGLVAGQEGSYYGRKRYLTKDMYNAINKYVDDPGERKKMIQQLAVDKAYSYGLDSEEKWDEIRQDPRFLGQEGGNMNKYQIEALHFLEDTDPDTYDAFNKVANVDAEKERSIWGNESFMRGYEQKARELERKGMELEQRALEEKGVELQKKFEKGDYTEQELQEYQNLKQQWDILQQDSKNQASRFPNIAALDADRLAQEALGQRNGALKRGILGVGEEVNDAVNWLGDVLQSPFLSKDQKIIDDLEDLGDKKFTSSVQRYRTSGNELVAPEYIPEFSDELKSDIEKIKSGNTDDKLSAVRSLILNNLDKVSTVKNPDAGKFNFTANSVFNTLSDVGSQVLANIGISGLTGGLGNISKARQLTTLFGTTFATTYNDYYTQAIEQNIKNPTTFAITHTAIEAASELINNDLAVAKKLVNPNSTLGKVLKNVTQKQWDDIVGLGKGTFSKILTSAGNIGKAGAKNAFSETVEETAGQLTGNVADKYAFGQDTDLTDGLKSTIVNTFIGTLPMGLLGLGGEIKNLTRSQKYGLYEAAQNKDKYFAAIDDAVAQGIFNKEKAEQVKLIIDKAATTLTDLSKKNAINIDQTDNQKADVLGDAMIDEVVAADIEKDVQDQKKSEDKRNKLIEKGHKAIDKLLEEKDENDRPVFKGIYRDVAKSDPLGFLKEISDQAQGIGGDGKPLKGGPREIEMIPKYGADIINVDKELFPAQKPGVKVVMPGEIKQPATTTITSKEPKPEAKNKQYVVKDYVEDSNDGTETQTGMSQDIKMREASTGFVGEIKREGSSSYGSADNISKKIGSNVNWNKDNGTLAVSSPNSKVIMLARNFEYQGKDLNNETKKAIKELSDNGAEFVVGDMPNVDTQFIDYLKDIGATFTIYHTEGNPRIDIEGQQKHLDIPDETTTQVMRRAKSGKPVTFNAYRIESNDNINEKTGAFFGDEDIVDNYLLRRSYGWMDNSYSIKGDKYKYQITLKNPLVIESKEEYVRELAKQGDLEARKIIPNWQSDDVLKWESSIPIKEVDEFIAKRAKEKGHDGIIGELEYQIFDKKSYNKTSEKLPDPHGQNNAEGTTANTEVNEPPKASEAVEPVTEVGENAEGTPPISEPPPRSKIHVERPATELSHKGLQDVANEFSLDDVKTRDKKTDIELRKEAEETISDWVSKKEYAPKVEGLVKKAENGDVLTDKERVILEQHLANISGEIRGMNKNTPEFDAKLAEIKRLKEAGEKTRSEAGAALRVPTFRSRPKDLADYYVEEMEAAGVEKLTEQQKETAEREYKDISETEKAYNEKIQALQDENAKLKAELEVKKAAKQKGAKKDFKKEREDIFASIQEKLKKARQDTQVTILPYAKELIAIAPDVAKLMRSYAEQGVIELSEMVKKLHGDLKPVIEDITEKDVRDLIAGVYNEKRPTRDQLAKTLRDLREEASLLNKLEELESGKEPVSEKKKIERNREIADLKAKVKNHDLSKIDETKNRLKRQIAKIEEQIKSGNFENKNEEAPLKLDKEAIALQDKLIQLRNERQKRLLIQEYEKSSKWNKIQTAAANVLGVPRTIMASMDYSAPLRQALLPTISHPVMASKAAVEMFKSSLSQKNYDKWFDNLHNSERYKLMQDSKLAITDVNDPKLSAKEEQYMNGLAEKIPVIGKMIKGSERAYTIYLNKMRVDLFNRFADQMQKDGRTFENSEAQYKQMAAFVNNMTGRGDLGKALNEAAPVLNQLFFSPRLMASRVNTLLFLPKAGIKSLLGGKHKVPPEIVKDYFRSLLSTAGLGLTILGMAKLAGADTEDDPRSPDFGKIKSGNTRWDIWGGHQQYIRVAAQLISGKTKSSTSGKINELNSDKAFSRTRGDVALGFFRGKMAPVPSIIWDRLTGENAIGDKMTTKWQSGPKEVGLKEYMADHLFPLTITGMQEALKDQGAKAWFTVGIPSVFGVGTTTYEPEETKSKKSKPGKDSKPEKKDKD